MFNSDITFEDLTYEVIKLIKEYGLVGEPNGNSSTMLYRLPTVTGISCDPLVWIDYKELLSARVPVRISLAQSAYMDFGEKGYNIERQSATEFRGLYSTTIDGSLWNKKRKEFISCIENVRQIAVEAQKRTKQFALQIDKMLADVN